VKNPAMRFKSYSPNSGRSTRSIPNFALTKAFTPTSRANHLPVHTKV
jgi:peroxiredoxin